MYEDGVIYRDNRLVNWCCRLKTAVSDIEVRRFLSVQHVPQRHKGCTKLVVCGTVACIAGALPVYAPDGCITYVSLHTFI